MSDPIRIRFTVVNAITGDSGKTFVEAYPKQPPENDAVFDTAAGGRFELLVAPGKAAAQFFVPGREFTVELS